MKAGDLASVDLVQHPWRSTKIYLRYTLGGDYGAYNLFVLPDEHVMVLETIHDTKWSLVLTSRGVGFIQNIFLKRETT